MNAVVDAPFEDATIISEHGADAPVSQVMEDADIIEFEKTPLNIVEFKPDAFQTALQWLSTQVQNHPVDTSTADGLSRAKQIRQMCTKVRGAAESAYKKWYASHSAQQKANIATRDGFIDSVQKIEAPIKAAIAEAEEKAQAAKRERDRIEAERIEGHRVALADLQGLPDQHITSPSAAITALLADLEHPGYIGVRDWQEFRTQAEEALSGVIDKLRAHLANAVTRERLAEIEAQQRAEAEARAEAERQQQAEAARIAVLREGIDAIKATTTMCVGMPSSFIRQQIEALTADQGTDYADLQQEADQARAATLDALNEMLRSTEQAEADAKELAELRAMRAEKEARERAEAEAAERKRAEEEARRVAAEHEAQAQREAAERAERERREAEEAARRAAEAAALARLQANASRLADSLTAVVACARAAGVTATELDAAESLLAEVAGGAL